MEDLIKILIVEDEKTLNGILTKRLKNLNYIVFSCFNGEEAWNLIKKEDFNIIIMDIMMPKMNGLEVLERMNKEEISIPVLFLTAKDSIEDRVIGLDLGAEDYLVKPFSFDELLARVRVILRPKKEKSHNILKVSNLILNKTSHIVTRNEKEISLSAKEFEVLEYLMKHEGEVLTRKRIESDVWDVDCCGLTNVIDVYIRYLRKKIDDDFENKLIHTIRGVGYMLKDDLKDDK